MWLPLCCPNGFPTIEGRPQSADRVLQYFIVIMVIHLSGLWIRKERDRIFLRWFLNERDGKNLCAFNHSTAHLAIINLANAMAAWIP
jgi:hypothetical protein